MHQLQRVIMLNFCHGAEDFCADMTVVRVVVDLATFKDLKLLSQKVCL